MATDSQLLQAIAPPAVLMVVGAFVVGLIAIASAAFVLRRFRAELAAELKREIAATSNPQAMQVQTPLEVKEHITFATTQEVFAIKEDVEQLRDEVRDGFDKLGSERRTSVANLHAKADETNKKVDEMRGELKLLTQQTHQIMTQLLSRP